MGSDIFPLAHTSGGIILPYVPTENEMNNCGYARKKEATCPRKRGQRQLIIGGFAPLIDYGSCPYHWHNMPIGGMR